MDGSVVREYGRLIQILLVCRVYLPILGPYIYGIAYTTRSLYTGCVCICARARLLRDT